MVAEDGYSHTMELEAYSADIYVDYEINENAIKELIENTHTVRIEHRDGRIMKLDY